MRAHARLPDPAAEKQLVLIDQQRFRMQVRVDGRVRREVEIGLGQAAGQKRREGDLRTPKGIYFVVDKHEGKVRRPERGVFRRLLDQDQLSGRADAAWGLRDGVIDAATAATIAAAWSERKLTPQTTPLGSGIGFHGWAEEWKAPEGWGAAVVWLRRHARARHRQLVRGSADRHDGRDVLTSGP